MTGSAVSSRYEIWFRILKAHCNFARAYVRTVSEYYTCGPTIAKIKFIPSHPCWWFRSTQILGFWYQVDREQSDDLRNWHRWSWFWFRARRDIWGRSDDALQSCENNRIPIREKSLSTTFKKMEKRRSRLTVVEGSRIGTISQAEAFFEMRAFSILLGIIFWTNEQCTGMI